MKLQNEIVQKKKGVSLFIPYWEIKELRKKYPDRFFQEFGIIIKEEGISLRRWEYKDRNQRIQTFISYDGLDSLLRFLGKHYPEKKEEESDDIQEWQERIYLLNEELGEWNDLSEAEKETISKGFLSIANELPDPVYAKDEDKQEARKNLIYASDFRDEGERINPGAMRAKVMKAGFTDLGNRTETMDEISFRYEVTGLFLKGLRKEYKKKFMVNYQRLKATKEGFIKGKLNSEVVRELREKVIEEFDSLEKVAVAPYKKWTEDLEDLVIDRFERAKSKRRKIELFNDALSLVIEVVDHIVKEEKKLR